MNGMIKWVYFVVFVFCFSSFSFAKTILVPVNVGAVSALISDGGEVSFSSESGEMDWLCVGGEPNLPWKYMRILLPPDADVATLSCALTGDSWSTVAEPIMIPATEVNMFVTDENNKRIESWPEGRTIVDGYDVEIYEANAFWPELDQLIVKKGSLRGWKMVELAVPLARYNPMEKQVLVLLSTQVSITYSLEDVEYAADKDEAKRVRGMVDNFDTMASAYLPKKSGKQYKYPTGTNGYVIAVSKSIRANLTKLDAFVAHKQSLGFAVTVITEDDTGATATGPEAALKFREWLQANYQAMDLKYVLIIDEPRWNRNSYFPFTRFLLEDNSGTDHFYAELTCDIDANNNGVYAEGIDEWECFYEVYVGRIDCYNNSFVAVDPILQRTMDYENATDTAWRRNALLGIYPMFPSSGATGFDIGRQLKELVLTPNSIASTLWFGTGSNHNTEEWTQENNCNPPPEYDKLGPSVGDVWSSNHYGVALFHSHGNGGAVGGVFGSNEIPKIDKNYPSTVFLAGCNTAAGWFTNNVTWGLLRDFAISTVGWSGSEAPGFGNYEVNITGGALGYGYVRRIAEGQSCGEALFNKKEEASPNLVRYAKQWIFNYSFSNLHGDPSVHVYPTDPPQINVTPFDCFYGVRYPSSPLRQAKKTYTLVNDSNSSIQWSATKNDSWFNLSTMSGTIPAHGTAAIELSMTSAVESFGMGKQHSAFTITDTTHNTSWTRPVTFEYKQGKTWRIRRMVPMADWKGTTRSDASWAALYDNNNNTYHEMGWSAVGEPTEVRFDMYWADAITGFSYSSPKTTLGRVKDYELYLSLDGETWGVPVVTGTFQNAGGQKQEVFFSRKMARYVRFVALSTHDGGPIVRTEDFEVYCRRDERGLRWRYYTWLFEDTVADVVANYQYPGSFLYDHTHPDFECTRYLYADSAWRYDGFIIPPVTGNYSFWISSGHDAELWLSTDSTTNNLTKIAYAPESTGVHEWDKNPVQHSVSISLTAGVPYRVVGICNAGSTRYSYASVAWDGPGISRQVMQSPFLSYRDPILSASAPVANDGSFSIPETAVIGDVVGTMPATDADAGDELSYYIVDGNEDANFRINQVSGEITLQKLLDYETTSGYSMQVAVVDDGGNNDIATATVSVLDGNDDKDNNAPVILLSKPLINRINIEKNKGVALLVDVQDDALPTPDAPTLLWTIESGPATPTFSSPTQPDTLISFPVIGDYVLRVTADDGQKTSFEEFHVKVASVFEDLEVSRDGLLAYYPFDEISGITAYDHSGNSHPATLNHEAWSTGCIGGSIKVDSSNSVVVVNTEGINSSPITKRTISMWVKPNTQSWKKQYIYDEGSAGNSICLMLFKNVMCFCINGTGGDWTHTYLYKTDIQSGQWYHVAMTLDGDSAGSSDGFHAYVDGVEVGVGPCGVISTSESIGIGGISGGEPGIFVTSVSTTEFIGKIDELRLYDRVLSPSEITILFAGILPAVDAGKDCLTTTGSVALNGSIQEDPSSTESITVEWEVTSGPGAVVFSDPSYLSPVATFAVDGLYTLRLNAVSESFLVFDEVNIRVGSAVTPNTAPSISDASFSVSEALAVGSVVGTCSFTDPDANDQHVFDIISGNTGQVFEIDAFTGTLTLISNLDWEQVNSYSLTVSIVDFAGATDSATIAVTVQNVANDDSDADGLDDAWEWLHFGSTAAQNGTDDPDSDGMNNEQEETLGSDPNDFNSPAGGHGLKGWWKLDETSGNIASDSSGNNHGTVNGSSWVSGYDAGALELDGIDDKVVANALGIDINTTTFTGWIKRNGTQANYCGVVFTRGSGVTTGVNLVDDKLRYHWNGGKYSWDSGLMPPDNEWCFFALVVEPTKATMYMGTQTGGLQSSVNISTHANETFSAPIVIGQDTGFNNRYYKGVIDDVRIYDRVLNNVEIGRIYQQNQSNQSPVVQDATFALVENSTIGTILGTVSASDPENNTMVYSITAGNEEGRFSIDASSGEILLTGILDYETATTHSLSVEVTDYFSPVTTATITVNVSNIVNDDSDNDGLTDEWEIIHFGSITGQDGMDDADYDGILNQQEESLNSDPNDPTVPGAEYKGLRAWWKLDETSGNIASDSSGNNHGTVNGSSWVSGYDAGALELDGIDDKVVANALDININTATFTGWIKRNGTQANYCGMVFTRGSGATTGVNLVNNKLRYHWNGGQHSWDSGLMPPDNEWCFFALVVEPTKATMYMGTQTGGLQSSVNISTHANETFSAPIVIGQDAGFNNRYYKGVIDDVRIYDVALDAATLANLYNGSNAAPVVYDASFSIAENSAIGSTVGTVQASDPDTGDSLLYAITAGNGAGVFVIDSATGKITVAALVDYETASSYPLTVTVTDPGALSDTATITITVTDIANDDSDADGLVDEWEIIHFASISAQDGAGDPDNDGASNRQEQTFNTDPMDANDAPSAEYINLRGWWKLDESVGTVAADSSENGLDASNTGGVLVGQTGYVDGAFTFDGVDGCSTTTGTDAPNSSILTIAAWIHPSLLSDKHVILGKRNQFIFETSGNKLRMISFPNRSHYSDAVLVANEWQFVVVTFTPSTTGGCRFYRNGVLIGTVDSVAINQNSNALSLGKSQAWQQHFEGGLDDIRLYDRILTDAEIGALYQQDAGIYNQWKGTKFTAAELANPAISGDAADVDADQLSTLVEYALGLDPKTHSGSLAGCAIELDGSNGWKVEFNRHASHSDIDLILEWSDELNPVNWQPVAQSIAGGVVQALNGATLVSETGSEPTVVELNVPSTVPHGFIRWTVERR